MLLNSRVLLNRSGRSALSAGIIPHGARNGIPKAQSRSIQAKASSRSHQRRAMLEYQREMDLLRSQDGGEKLSKDDLLAKAQMNLMQQYGNPSADAYAMSAFPTFPSLSLPYSVKPQHWSSYPSWSSILEQFVLNARSRVDSATSMFQLATMDSIPGIDLSNSSDIARYTTQVPRYFGIRSVKEKSFTRPLAKIALETFQKFNTALAAKDVQALKTYSSAEALTNALARVKSSGAGLSHVWTFHRELSPTRIVNIGAMQGHVGREPPRIGNGNRFVIQALVKFHIEQSLEAVNARGKPISRAPVQKKSVESYAIIEKKMYMLEPWHVRQILIPTKKVII